MIEAIKNKDIRNKILFTLCMLLIFRLGSNIPVPGIDRAYLTEMFSKDRGLFDLFDLFSGGAFSNFTIFALSITPYITASIIIQLLTIAFPYFEQLSKEGDAGRKKMATITRYLAVVLAVIQGAGLTIGLFKKAIIDQSTFNLILIILILTAGTAFLMWLGEKINESGIGNGISLIIFAGIVCKMPTFVRELFAQVKSGEVSAVAVIALIVAAVIITMIVIEFQQGMRKIPVQYAKRTAGRKSYGGEATFMPIKINQSGVIPIIFSIAIIQVPLTISYFVPTSKFAEFVTKYLSPSGTPGLYIYIVLNAVLTIVFTYFYTSIMFKPNEVADNLRQAGGSIPGIRQGKQTEEYLKKVSRNLSCIDSLFLASVAVIPAIVGAATPFHITFGGTSLLIVVGVALELSQRINTEMIQRKHHGFLR